MFIRKYVYIFIEIKLSIKLINKAEKVTNYVIYFRIKGLY